jgi:hypothetical protein
MDSPTSRVREFTIQTLSFLVFFGAFRGSYFGIWDDENPVRHVFLKHALHGSRIDF